ncbi:hypothetical protein A6R68_15846 [Neotoma lepida]|uniref:Uncharacterized protein n=1 Tax=Neotoma lepida TaxID=56216 RepID=A0A1A6H5M1_NEOLE|nr:hypothetical protein A6R68_15846 [Neotoma lepida]
MKTILSNQTIHIPENVHITPKGCSYCEGPQEREFNNMKIKLYLLRTKRSSFGHVLNTIKAVTLDFHYKTGSMYADLFTNIVIQENGVFIEI